MSLAAPWRGLDDTALLAHFRQRTGVHVGLVVDAEECSAARIDGVLQGRFEFVGESHVLGARPAWLHNPSADVEWHILLHKFYYAPGLAQRWVLQRDAAAAARWAELVDGWIAAAVPPGFIAADVTGRRVQNWLYAALAMVREGAPIDPAFWRRLLVSLHDQVEHLCANLTPKRNHRTLELYAIFLAGVALPEFERAAHWRAFALEQTAANVEADLRPDGVHVEQSTDYHCLALRNWMHVCRLAEAHGLAVPLAMDAALARAHRFAAAVHRPDGGMPSFSDGDARGYAAVLDWGAARWGTPPAQRQIHFEHGGYHVWRSAAQHWLFDCGPLGEGNHGHFDALSFEWFADGRPLVVDPGRYTYSEAGDTNWRLHFRGTAAHNTVCVDGRNQTRYEPRPVKDASRHAAGSVRHRIAGPEPETVLLEAHDGGAVDLLRGRTASHAYDAVHERCLVWVDQRYAIVSDRLHAPGAHRYELTFQFGAGLDVSLDRREGARVAAPGLRVVQPARSGQQAALQPGWVSARYGHKTAAPALKTVAHGCTAAFDTVLCAEDTPLAAHVLPVPGCDGGALVIRLGDVEDTWFHGGRPGRWQVGACAFEGTWAHWRRDAQGRVLRVVSA